MSKIKWNKNLSVVHGQLKATNSTLHSTVAKELTKSQKDSSGAPKANTLTVDIEFCLETVSKHGKSSILIPVNIPGYDYFSMADSYSLDSKKYSKDSLQARHEVGFDKKIHENVAQKKGPEHYFETPTYHTKFHHSEQAFYEYIIQRSNLDSIVKRLTEHGLKEGTAITAVTIHMHSIRYVCGCCEIGGLGLISKQYGFRDTLLKALEHEGLALNQEASINIEVSADKPDAKKSPVKAYMHKDIDLSKSSGVIVESDTNEVSMLFDNTDLYNRTVMVSLNVNEMSPSYLRVFKNIEIKEYATMIECGKALRDHVCATLAQRFDKVYEGLEDDVNYTQEEQDAFFELALMIDGTSNSLFSISLAKEVIKVRDELEDEIAQDRKLVEKIKSRLLKEKVNPDIVKNLSLDALHNINILVENAKLSYRDLKKIVDTPGFIELCEKEQNIEEISKYLEPRHCLETVRPTGVIHAKNYHNVLCE
jgi:hypothetical protein